MKGILSLILVFATLVPAAVAQNGEKSTKYFNRTEGGFLFGISSFETNIYDGIQKEIKNNEIVVNFQTINGLMFNNRAAVGAGVGVEVWQNGMFYPVFGHLAYYFKPADNSVFANGSIGYGIGSRDATANYASGEGALMFSVGLGYVRKVAKRLQFHFEAFYKYQAVESTYGIYIEDTLRTTVDYKVPLSFIGFRVGIHFK